MTDHIYVVTHEHWQGRWITEASHEGEAFWEFYCDGPRYLKNKSEFVRVKELGLYLSELDEEKKQEELEIARDILAEKVITEICKTLYTENKEEDVFYGKKKNDIRRFVQDNYPELTEPYDVECFWEIAKRFVEQIKKQELE